MTWIVLWLKNGRLGSVANTPENLVALREQLHLGLIQRDTNGTEHYEVFGVIRPRKERQ